MKNMVLKAITALATGLFLVSACAMDSVSYIPVVVCAASLSWLGLFGYANVEGVEHDG